MNDTCFRDTKNACSRDDMLCNYVRAVFVGVLFTLHGYFGSEFLEVLFSH